MAINNEFKRLKQKIKNIKNYKTVEYTWTDHDTEDVENLINRIKFLEVCLKAEEKYSEGLNDDIKSLLHIEPNNNFIRKDKIKDKIEEISGMLEVGNIEREIYNRGEYAIEVLQELLEE